MSKTPKCQVLGCLHQHEDVYVVTFKINGLEKVEVLSVSGVNNYLNSAAAEVRPKAHQRYKAFLEHIAKPKSKPGATKVEGAIESTVEPAGGDDASSDNQSKGKAAKSN